MPSSVACTADLSPPPPPPPPPRHILHPRGCVVRCWQTPGSSVFPRGNGPSGLFTSCSQLRPPHRRPRLCGPSRVCKMYCPSIDQTGPPPNVSTFNSLRSTLCNADKMYFCIDLLRDVNDLGLFPDISMYKALIPALSMAGKIDEAFRILSCAMQQGHRPFPSLYAAILEAMYCAGRFSDVVFFGDMLERGHPPNRPAYSMLVKMCVRGGRVVEAANFLVEMSEMGLVPMSNSVDMVVEVSKHCGKHDLARRMEQAVG
ncbi:hypothetical protein KSP40_PGU003968 [Platanthera guangdongensis]|uniref:Pentatricopeptide repeat-containing protein n=1 Tax=Platanthera guangdongensis TaxID=2320717 RepID=A0ABR2MST7_9ASPA